MSTFWGSDVQEAFWSKCQPSGTYDRSTCRHIEEVTCRKYSGQSVDLLRCLWQVDMSTFWGSDMQEIFWSKCRPSGMCDRSTYRHFEAVICRKHSGESVYLLGCVTGRHINILRQWSTRNSLVRVSTFWDEWQVDILRQWRVVNILANMLAMPVLSWYRQNYHTLFLFGYNTYLTLCW